MEIKMIEGRACDRLRQRVKDLLERTEMLKPKQIDELWYDNRQVCRLLGVSLRTLQNYRDKGLISYSQTGHKCYYRIADIDRFMEKNRIEKDKATGK
jgi:hypothetical protein